VHKNISLELQNDNSAGNLLTEHELKTKNRFVNILLEFGKLLVYY